MRAEEMDRVGGSFLPSRNELDRLEEKLESSNNKILYLIKRINQMSKAQSAGGGGHISDERLATIAHKLREKGIVLEYTDGRGFAKLKGLDQRGLDNIKKINTIFPLEMIESYLDNVV